MVVLAPDRSGIEPVSWTLSSQLSCLEIVGHGAPIAEFVAMLLSDLRDLIVGEITVYRREEGYTAVQAWFKSEDDCERVLDRVGVFSSDLLERSGELVVLAPVVLAS